MTRLIITRLVLVLAVAGLPCLFVASRARERKPPRDSRKAGGPGPKAKGKRPGGAPDGVRKPRMKDTIKADVYADNWFILYINGKLVAVDSTEFIPHNGVSVDILPTYPMTIAVMARDNADPKTGMEYADTHIGDGGFILKFGDGTVADARRKAKAFSRGPVGRDTKNPRAENVPIPDNWYAVDFDDRDWARVGEYSEEQVNPKQPFYDTISRGRSSSGPTTSHSTTR